jgi:septal ring factor EnvC (AmiA/AmiB activator)
MQMRATVNTQTRMQRTEKQRRPGLTAAALCLLIGALAPPSLFAQETSPEEKLAQLNAAIAEIETWLNTATSSRSELESELRESTRKIDSIETGIAENQTRISALQTRLSELNQRSDSLAKEKTAQETLITQAVRASFISGREPYLKLLLNQQDPAKSARMLHYYESFNRERLSRVELFRQTLAELAANRMLIEASSEELAASQKELQSQLLALSTQQTERSALLVALEEEIASNSDELQQLTEDRGRLEALLEKIQEAIANIPPPEQLTPFAQAQGSMPWPVAGTPLNRFGAAYSDGNLHRQGVILSAELGSAVRAVHPGRVVFSDWLRGSGLLVVVDHGGGYLSLYANNQSLVKRKGDWVNRGEALATAGENAGLGSPGIYFEIRHNGQAQDPAQWCTS